MKCVNCGQDNKDKAVVCRKCGREFGVSPAWFPDWRWHMKMLGTIYAALIALYFGVSAALAHLPKPYKLRPIPLELTPWLHPSGKVHLPEEQLKAPERPTLPAVK